MSRGITQEVIASGMSVELTRSALSSAKYEVVTIFVSAVVGALGVPFYLEATAKAEWKDQVSSIAANVLGIILFTKGSLDYLYDLIQKHEYGKATGIIVAAAILYSPQVLISIMESNSSVAWTVFAAVATGLSGSFTSAYAVSQIPDMYQSAKAAIVERFCSQATNTTQKTEKENILINLRVLLDRMRVSNYYSILDGENVDSFTRKKLLDLSVKFAETAPQPCVEDAGYMPTVARGVLGSIFVGLLLFGTLFSYGCGTEKSLGQDFKVPPTTAFLASFVLLSFQYLLNVTGGFGVARGVVDTLSLPNYKCVLPNEKTVGGKAGLALSVAAPILGLASAAFSGKPAFEFSRTCESSIVQPALSYINHFLTSAMPFIPADGRAFGHLADYSARFFNTIFAAKFFYWVLTFGVERFGSEVDNQFLFVKNQLEKLIALVEKTPAENVSELFLPENSAHLGADVRNVADTEESLVSRVGHEPEVEDGARVVEVPRGVSRGITLAELIQPKKEFISAFFSKEQASSMSFGSGIEARLLPQT